MSAACDRSIAITAGGYCGDHCQGWCLLEDDGPETCAKLCALGPLTLPKPMPPRFTVLGPVTGDGIARARRLGYFDYPTLSIWSCAARKVCVD